jgi:protease PrsW
MLVALISAIAIAPPTALYAWLVARIDRYEKEPVKYAVAAFLWGMIPSAILAVIFSILFSVPVMVVFGEESQATSFITTAIIAPIVEEVVKAIAVAAIYVWRRREFDGWIDGIVYGSLVGFGFAYIENIIYLTGTESPEQWVFLYFFRVLIFGFLHGFFTSLTGIGFGLARHRRNDFAKALLIAIGLTGAIFAHAIHNGTLTLAEQNQSTGSLLLCGVNYFVLIALSVGLGVIAKRKEQMLFRQNLADEVPAVLTQQAYGALSNLNGASKGYLNSLSKGARPGFVQVAAELALKKRQLAQEPGDGLTLMQIDRLRGALQLMCGIVPQAPAVASPDAAAPDASAPVS